MPGCNIRLPRTTVDPYVLVACRTVTPSTVSPFIWVAACFSQSCSFSPPLSRSRCSSSMHLVHFASTRCLVSLLQRSHPQILFCHTSFSSSLFFLALYFLPQLLIPIVVVAVVLVVVAVVVVSLVVVIAVPVAVPLPGPLS